MEETVIKCSVAGIKRKDGGHWVVDYYLNSPNQEEKYIFTKNYSRGTYGLVKGGISVQRLVRIKSPNKSVMKLVKSVALMVL